MTIYRVAPDVDNFQSLLPADTEVVGMGLMALDGSPRSSSWQKALTAIIDNADAAEPDILDLGAGNLVLHGKSWVLLESEFRPYCEFLPVRWGKQLGHVVNPIGLADCLDTERSRWVIGKESGKRIRIEKFEFIQGKVPSSRLFKIEERRFDLFCTEFLKGLVEKHGITGLNFDRVWTSETR